MQFFAEGVVMNRDFLRSVFQSMLRARVLENKLSSHRKRQIQTPTPKTPSFSIGPRNSALANAHARR